MAVVETEVRRTLQTDIESPTAKLVFLSLVEQGRATVEELQARLGEPRLTLYGVLGSLEKKGIVTVAEDGTGRRYEPAV